MLSARDAGSVAFGDFLRYVKRDLITARDVNSLLDSLVRSLAEFLGTRDVFTYEVFPGCVAHVPIGPNRDDGLAYSGVPYGDIIANRSVCHCAVYCDGVVRWVLVFSKSKLPTSPFAESEEAIFFFLRLLSRYLSQTLSMFSDLRHTRHRLRVLLGHKFLRDLSDPYLAYDILELAHKIAPDATTLSLWRLSRRTGKLELVAEKNPARKMQAKSLDLSEEVSAYSDLKDTVVWQDTSSGHGRTYHVSVGDWIKQASAHGPKETESRQEQPEGEKLRPCTGPQHLMSDLAEHYRPLASRVLLLTFGTYSAGGQGHASFLMALGAVVPESSISAYQHRYLQALCEDAAQVLNFLSSARHGFHSLRVVQDELVAAQCWQDIGACMGTIGREVLNAQHYVLLDLDNPTAKPLLSSPGHAHVRPPIPTSWGPTSTRRTLTRQSVLHYSNVTGPRGREARELLEALAEGTGQNAKRASVVLLRGDGVNCAAVFFSYRERRGLHSFQLTVLHSLEPVLRDAVQRVVFPLASRRRPPAAGPLSAQSCEFNTKSFLRRMLEHALSSVGASAGHVFLCGPTEQTLYFGLGIGCVAANVGVGKHLTAGGGSLVGLCAQSRKVLRVRRESDRLKVIGSNISIPYLAWIPEVEWAAAAPVEHAGRLTGVMTVVTSAKRGFDRSASRKLADIARVFAVEHASLAEYHRMRGRSSIAETLLSLSLTMAPVRSDTFNGVCREIARFVRCKVVTLRIHDRVGDALVRVGAEGPRSAVSSLGVQMDPCVGAYAFSHATDVDYVYLPDVHDRACFSPYPGLDYMSTRDTTESELTIPLRSSTGACVGVLNLESCRPHAFQGMVASVCGMGEVLGAFVADHSKAYVERLRYETDVLGFHLLERAHEAKHIIMGIKGSLTKELQSESISQATLQNISRILEMGVNHWSSSTEDLKSALLSSATASLDLSEIIRSGVDSVVSTDSYWFRGVDVRTHLPPPGTAELKGVQPALFGIAIRNIMRDCAQALRRTYDPDPRITIIGSVVGSSHMMLEFIDTGRGIGSDALDAFESPKPTSDSGVGLWLAGRYLRSMGMEPTIGVSDRSENYHVKIAVPLRRQG